VRDYTIDILVRDLLGLIDALELERVHLCGHDWGGGACLPASIPLTGK
jgi:pimeloyl-ACP methyl ester carboxylesterase